MILEAPFLNISQAAKEYLLAPLILNNRWIVDKMDKALDSINLRFNTDKKFAHLVLIWKFARVFVLLILNLTQNSILKINSKILILHAADDWFIPKDHSLDLIKICKEKRPAEFPPVKLIEYHEDLMLGHNKIYLHEELYPAIK